jgi:cullin 1
LVIWRDELFQKVKDRVLRAVIELITKDRDGEQVNHTEITGVVQSFGTFFQPTLFKRL